MKTITWSGNSLKIVDQTQLPQKLVYLHLDTFTQLWWAIRKLRVRGAPAIGIAAGFGVFLGMRNSRARTFSQFMREFDRLKQSLKKSRPTAVNLSWALERMERKIKTHAQKSPACLKALLLQEARKILAEDRNICRQIGRFGSKLIKDKDIILTHCNAGGLATADYGTALGIIYAAKSEGKRIKVYAGETRPVLQGARLTSWELIRHKVDVTLICDNMAADLMQRGEIKKIVVGADRIAANGDTVNKIGTYNLAVLAKFHQIPFYVVAPFSSFDLRLKTGRQIPIEQREAQEVRQILAKQIAPKGIDVYNPAFDLTPQRLISAIVTERGIIRPPYKVSLKKLFNS